MQNPFIRISAPSHANSGGTILVIYAPWALFIELQTQIPILSLSLPVSKRTTTPPSPIRLSSLKTQIPRLQGPPLATAAPSSRFHFRTLHQASLLLLLCCFHSKSKTEYCGICISSPRLQISPSSRDRSRLNPFSLHSNFATTRTTTLFLPFPTMSSPPQHLDTKIDDIFESSLNLEQIHYQEGHTEGYKEGLISGKEEGREVGLKVGFEVGEELGFYRGILDVWNSTIILEPNCFSSRIQKSVKQMEELIEKYPILDPENEGVQDIMDALRLKFRAITTTLSMKLEYQGYPKSIREEIY